MSIAIDRGVSLSAGAGEVGAQETEDFLVSGCRERDWFFRGFTI